MLYSYRIRYLGRKRIINSGNDEKNQPYYSEALRIELEKIIQSIELKQIDPSDSGRAQLWQYTVSKYNSNQFLSSKNQFFVKDTNHR